MIIGIGTDLADIERFRRIEKSAFAQKFYTRILTPSERLELVKRGHKAAEYIASRFAAKEAVVKALGCGIGGKVGFQDVTVHADASGKPVCQLSEEASAKLGLNVQARIHLSITHTATHALAFAVVEL